MMSVTVKVQGRNAFNAIRADAWGAAVFTAGNIDSRSQMRI